MLKSLLKDTIIYGVANGLSKSLMLFLVPIYTTVFSPDAYGIIDIINSTTIFFTILGMLQLESSIGRFYYEAKSQQETCNNTSTVFWSIIIVSLPLILLLYSSSSAISILLFETPEYSKVIKTIGYIIPFANIYALLITLMRYMKKPFLFGFFSLTQITLTLSSSILFVLKMELGIIGVFYGQLCGFFISSCLILAYLFHYRILAFVFKVETIKKYLSFSIPLLPAVLIGWGVNHINRFLMLGYISLSDIGLYAIALKIASMLKLVEDAIRMTWGPFLFENLSKSNHKLIFRSALNNAILLAFLLVCLLSLFTKEIYLLFIDKKYLEAQNITILLLMAMGINILVQIVLIGPAITKKTFYNSILSIVAFGSNIILFLLLVPYWGILGVSLSLLGSIIIYFVCSWIVSERLYLVGFQPSKILIPFFFCALIVGLILFYDPLFIMRIFLGIIVLIVFTFLFFQYKKDEYQISSN